MKTQYQHSTHSVYILAAVGAGIEITERISKGYRTTMTKRGFIVKTGETFALTPAGLASLESELARCSPANIAFSKYLECAAALMPTVRAAAAK